jgi:GDP-L-fucose synthase
MSTIGFPRPDTSFWRGRRVLVTGAAGFIGSNLVPVLRGTGCDLTAVTHRDADLTDPAQARALLELTRPHLVFHLAGLVGGILANRDQPAEFCHTNLMLGAVVLHEAWRAGVGKFVTLIGGCSYPASAPSPIGEEALWDGYPQSESAPYSLAKRMSVTLADSYRRQYGFNAVVLVPGNVYGPHDNFDLTGSHVIPALVRKFWEARQTGASVVAAWGTGRPTRDFVYIDDVCHVLRIAAERYNSSDILNVSSGRPVSIRAVTELVAELVGFEGRVIWDATRPDGQLHKGFDVTRLREHLGVECPTPLREGLQRTIEWFVEHQSTARGVIAPCA